MGYEEVTEIVQVVELSKGYHATIHVMRSEDSLELQAILLGARKQRQEIVRNGDKDPVMTSVQEVNSEGFQIETIKRGVAKDPETGTPLWNLDDKHGQVWPLEAPYIKKLTKPDFETLFAAIQKHNEAPDKSGTAAGATPVVDHPTAGTDATAGHGHLVAVR